MKRSLIVVTALSALVATGALADGPSGSWEGDRRGRRTSSNDVHCSKGRATFVKTYADVSRGVEVCKDGGQPHPAATVPGQGRVIVSRQQGGYIAADGDRHNPQQARGYARVDGKGVRCSQGRDQDATRSRTSGVGTCTDQG